MAAAKRARTCGGGAVWTCVRLEEDSERASPDQLRKAHGTPFEQLMNGRATPQELAARGVQLTPEQAALLSRVRAQRLPLPP
ncbi:hypothetical protein Rsub_05283 [Raphidocelis subcapitata]|uniref:Uncharacterized protein n=1 Tax=Raphidocelis subcapitata TaxID=307507 RepID=A0A2V0NX47_9CHLO|nr:hypothetical protein Rsub_05283 [Raphidocelis subcapitata]|eukprot:GBF92201.1 hypothetical protein Rsub_05283 [Raphidocelis subcapitata]